MCMGDLCDYTVVVIWCDLLGSFHSWTLAILGSQPQLFSSSDEGGTQTQTTQEQSLL